MDLAHRLMPRIATVGVASEVASQTMAGEMQKLKIYSIETFCAHYKRSLGI
jgi:hypothetical protein